jgi:membrane protease subunit HflK
VTRERLYLETMETVLQGSSKVMIDSNSGNNMLYLPLDKMQSGSTSSGSGSDSASAGAAVASALSNAADRAKNTGVDTSSIRESTRGVRQ